MRKIAMLSLWVAVAAAAPAEAQTEVGPKSEAQSLACLVKPATPPTYPERHSLDRGVGAMRVLLKFRRPDAAPEVEVLFNSAREDMQDEVHAHLRRYRLPCLTPQDGVVSAVQEFSFSNTDRDPTPMPWERGQGQQPACLVQPRTDMRTPPSPRLVDEVQHVVVAFTFLGDGQQPPDVKLLHSTGDKHLDRMVRERVSEYRMPCRQGTEGPQMFRQQFSYRPAGHAQYGFKKEAFSLLEFLRLLKGRQQLKADFDFTTMNCPFKVVYSVYGGNVPNEAVVPRTRPDPNRQPFLAWLAKQQLDFKNESQQRDLFGTQLQIEIPCTALKLGQAAS